MYSIPLILVALLFLGLGLKVVFEKGFTRLTTPFFAFCLTTFFWQATWSLLFQTEDPVVIMYLIKFGWLLIMFLPTTLYHFLVHLSGSTLDRPYVRLSYLATVALAISLVSSDWFINGYYSYFFGPYPKAGLLHPVHVLQSLIVASRGLYIIYNKKQGKITLKSKEQQRLCVIAVMIYFFAAIDYLCNYGFEFYPPGVIFAAISLGALAWAILRYDLMSPMALAATVAHEMRTPLATIRLQAMVLANSLPEIYRGYQLAIEHGLCDAPSRSRSNNFLATLSTAITKEVDRSNIVIDMMLASANMEALDNTTFQYYSIEACLYEALERYPFSTAEREQVKFSPGDDFQFYGSDNMLVFVLFNLIKNSLYAIKVAGKGDIEISLSRKNNFNSLQFMDTAMGISPDVLPHIFDNFYSTKRGDNGCAGIGLAFCSRVMDSLGGRIRCESRVGEHTTFILEFPVVQPQSLRQNSG